MKNRLINQVSMLARIATGTVGAMFVIGYGVCIARVLNYLVDHTNE